MRVFSTQAVTYASLEELQRSLLLQVRRFRKIDVATAAEDEDDIQPILLSVPGGAKKPPKPVPGEPAEMQALDTMMAQVILLKNMSAQILTTFQNNPKAKPVHKLIESLIADIGKRSEALRLKMRTEANQQVSKLIKGQNHKLIDYIAAKLPKNAIGHAAESYLIGNVIPPKMTTPVAAEVAYIKITQLKDKNGYIHPEFYIVTAHPLQPIPKMPPLFVATTPHFKIPSKMRWSSMARTAEELHQVVMDLLLQDNIISSVSPRKIPVDPSALKFTHDNIKTTSIKGDDITVRVKDKTPEAMMQTAMDVWAQLKAIVSTVDPKNRDVIRYKIDHSAGTIFFRFSLPGKLRGRMIPDDLMKRLAMLNVDTQTLQRIKTAIEDPE
jgi:hypothetical protein